MGTYVCVVEGRISPREQGDIGEFSAIDWLKLQGYAVYLPLGHSPDCDMIATNGPHTWRVQVKTSTVFRNGRWDITVCTRGGNRSWSGLVKHLDPLQIDYLFVLVADGRRWFIPAAAVGGGCGIILGGPKYAAYEVEAGRPLVFTRASSSLVSEPPAGFRSGQTDMTVNHAAQPSQVRILPPP
jgi:hypothetical protein